MVLLWIGPWVDDEYRWAHIYLSYTDIRKVCMYLRERPAAADQVAAVRDDARHDVGHVLVQNPDLGGWTGGQQRGAIPPLAGQHHPFLAHEREGEASLLVVVAMGVRDEPADGSDDMNATRRLTRCTACCAC